MHRQSADYRFGVFKLRYEVRVTESLKYLPADFVLG